MTVVASYFAQCGIKVDNDSLKAVDKFLSNVQKRLERGLGKNGLNLVPTMNFKAFDKHLKQALGKRTFQVPLNIKISQASLDSLRNQVKNALSTIPINVKVGNVQGGKQSKGQASTGGSKSPVTAGGLSVAQLNTMRRQIARLNAGSSSNPTYWKGLKELANKNEAELFERMDRVLKARGAGKGGKSPGYSWSPNPSGKGGSTPHLAEWLAGRPDKSSLSAANRRYGDVLMNEGFGIKNLPGTKGFVAESVVGGIGRAGSSTFAGRGLGALGSALGGARGGAVGLVAGAALNGVMAATRGIWTGLATMITTPFKLVGGAISTVTDGFYRLALAIAPVVAGFMGINKKVQDVTSKEIGLNTVSQKHGTTGDVERKWLYNMAQAEGMRYGDMIMPYASFMNAYAPRNGVEASREMFQAFSQYGRVHGATKESSGKAFYAVSQIKFAGLLPQ